MEANKRSFAKAVSWRVTGTIDTMMVSYIITGNPLMALKIGAVEVMTKILLYYFHERIWGKIQWGRNPITMEDQHQRSAVKALSWRATGTMDTIFISYLITGHIPSALGIGAFEIITKCLLYYAHERVWSMVSWGKIKVQEMKVNEVQVKEVHA
jgi:uncharacterized membrane protein